MVSSQCSTSKNLTIFHLSVVLKIFNESRKEEKENVKTIFKHYQQGRAPKFSDALTLFQPGGADFTQHYRGCTKNFPVVTYIFIDSLCTANQSKVRQLV